jgi:hypothetical protein
MSRLLDRPLSKSLKEKWKLYILWVQDSWMQMLMVVKSLFLIVNFG